MKKIKRKSLFETLSEEEMEVPLQGLASLDGLDINMTKEELIKALFDMGCGFEEWRDQAKVYKNKYTKEIGSCSIVHSDKNESYDSSASPLESLSYHLSKDFFYIPPPEILMVIVNQFKWYMENGGSVSLEEAFFGSPRGRGVYASRKLYENYSYAFFHQQYSQTRNSMSQADLVEYLVDKPKGKDSEYNPLSDFQNHPDFNVESFLKGYRRWKSEKK
ncbi:MAG: hypothetical protein ACI9SP_003119 [Arenicella sp.]|jgi:hypothetical protein